MRRQTLPCKHVSDGPEGQRKVLRTPRIQGAKSLREPYPDLRSFLRSNVTPVHGPVSADTGPKGPDTGEVDTHVLPDQTRNRSLDPPLTRGCKKGIGKGIRKRDTALRLVVGRADTLHQNPGLARASSRMSITLHMGPCEHARWPRAESEAKACERVRHLDERQTPLRPEEAIEWSKRTYAVDDLRQSRRAELVVHATCGRWARCSCAEPVRASDRSEVNSVPTGQDSPDRLRGRQPLAGSPGL
jgi:hypothetical protein